MKQGECDECGQPLWVPSAPVEFTAYCSYCREDGRKSRSVDTDTDRSGGGDRV